jgi:hypothetical protein
LERSNFSFAIVFILLVVVVYFLFLCSSLFVSLLRIFELLIRRGGRPLPYRKKINISFELLSRIELPTSSLPRKCSTTELQQPAETTENLLIPIAIGIAAQFSNPHPPQADSGLKIACALIK